MDNRKYNKKNIDGRYATSADCLTCELCYNALPDFFEIDEDGKSYVKKQPEAPKEHEQFLEVMNNCPIHGIYDKSCGLKKFQIKKKV